MPDDITPVSPAHYRFGDRTAGKRSSTSPGPHAPTAITSPQTPQDSSKTFRKPGVFLDDEIARLGGSQGDLAGVREPRVWHDVEDIPDDVYSARDRNDDVWSWGPLATAGRAFQYHPDEVGGQAWAPFTEVLT